MKIDYLKKDQLKVVNHTEICIMMLPPPNFIPLAWMKIKARITRSLANRQFLGQYNAMLKSKDEKSFPR